MAHPIASLKGDPRSLPLVGIEIGGTKLQIVVADRSGTEISRRWRALADRAQGGPGIQRQISDGLRELLQGQNPAAVAVGFGGPIDVTTGRIRRSHQIAGWEDFPLRDWLSSQVGCPVKVENDSNVAAFGEATRGAGRDLATVFYCNFGSGVGGGFVVDGRIYHGRPPGEMEFGHLRLNLDAPSCTVESECSGWAVDRQLRDAAASQPQSLLAERLRTHPTRGGEATLLTPLLAAGDPTTAAVFERLCRNIAFGLSHVVHLLNPAVVVMGGGLAMLGEGFGERVASELPTFVMSALHPLPEIRLSALGEDAVPIGALELAARIATIETQRQ